MFKTYQRNTYVSQDSKNIAILTWVGCLFTLFLFPLILYLAKTDDDYIKDQSKEAINWSITFIAAFFGLSLVMLILITIYEPLGYIIGIGTTLLMLAHLIFCFLGAVSSYHGKDFELTYMIRLFK